MKKILILLCLVVLGVGAYMWFDKTDDKKEKGENAATENELENEDMEDKQSETDPITEKINAMSLDEKIGQLFIAGIDGTEMTDETAEMIETNKIGGIILFKPNLETPDQSLQLVNDLKQLDKAQDIPLFISVDQEGGKVERLPGFQQLKTAAEIGQQSDDFAYDNGVLLANLLQGYGMNLNFSPVMDVNSNPDNPVIGDRAFSDDPESVADIGVNVMRGMQEEGVVTAVKHFPGHGDTNEDSHEALPVVNKTRDELEKTELVPFKAAVEAGADMVLLAHIKLPELGIDMPASMSKEAVDMLREEWDYDGVVVTDDLTMGAITDNYQMEDVSVQSLKAGVDLLMVAHEQEKLETSIQGVNKAIEQGDITEESIDESVYRILTLKDKYHLDNETVDQISVEELNQEIDAVYEGE